MVGYNKATVKLQTIGLSVVDLTDKGFKIISAVNILKSEYKKDPSDEGKSVKSQIKLRLFMLTFDNSESIDKIYGIKTIAFQVIKIEAIRQNSTRIVQCKKCQGYNHLRSSCYRKARCVKCADKQHRDVSQTQRL